MTERNETKRVAGVLSDFGCSLTPGRRGRVRPTDENICLSILDYIAPDEVEEEGVEGERGGGRTQLLLALVV